MCVKAHKLSKYNQGMAIFKAKLMNLIDHQNLIPADIFAILNLQSTGSLCVDLPLFTMQAKLANK